MDAIRRLTLKQIILYLFAVLTVGIAAQAALMIYVSVTSSSLQEKHKQRYNSYLLADQLRQSSDDLTRMARTYVVTGDAKYEAMYNEILDIRNGLKPRPADPWRIYWDLVLDPESNHALPHLLPRYKN